VELEVVGNLTSGQYFYGTDNVWPGGLAEKIWDWQQNNKQS